MKSHLTSLWILCLAAALPIDIQASNYYISSISGDDSRTSTQAKSSITPWKSISKLNSFFSSLQPGDSVLFERGGVYTGTIIPTKSGTSTAPITLGAYGTGDKPLITVFTKASGWTSLGNGIWESAAISTSITDLNMVLFDGQLRGMGRYPNADATNKGYLKIDSHSSTNSITSSQLPSSPTWTGAEVVVRANHWVLDRSKVKSQSGTTLYLTPCAGAGTPIDGFGFFIQKSLKTLDQLGEWYYNPSTKKISVFFGSDSPSSHVVEMGTSDIGIKINNFDYLNFEDLSIEGANRHGIDVYSASHNNICNCDINLSGEDGIYGSNSNNILIEGCSVSNSLNNGIQFPGGSSYVIIRNCTISDTGLIAGMGLSTAHTYEAIRLNGDHHLVELNKVLHTGYLGIRFTGSYTTVRNNYIDNFCSVKDDGGGIYTSTVPGVVPVSRVVKDNIILNGIGAKEGTTATTVRQASGIYLDDNSCNITVTGNTAFNCGKAGLFVHNGYNFQITGNTFFNNTAQFRLDNDHTNTSHMVNITFTNNICVSKSAANLVAQFCSCESTLSKIGNIDYNSYSRPLDDNLTIDGVTGEYTPSSVTTHYSLSTWQAKYGKDAHTRKSPVTYPSSTDPNSVFLFDYNPTTLSKTVTLNGSYVDFQGNKYSSSVTLAPFASILLIKDSNVITTTNIPVISSSSTASGTVGSAFSYQITASFSPTSYGATGLPAGLSINTTTGLISGTPTTAGTYSVGLSVKNSAGTGTKALTITIASAPQPPVISSATSASGTMGSAFSYQITASNTPTSYGANGLPAGLSINSTNGLISGTPTTAGSFSVGLLATNKDGTGTKTLTITIAAAPQPPVITSTTTSSSTVGTAFNYQITASNNPTSYGATGLPAGLSVDTTKGLISGIPTTSGVYTITLNANNTAGTGSATMTLTVNAAPVLQSVTTFTLINADSDQDIKTLVDGEVIDLAKVGSNITIRANTNPVTVGSVIFQLSGTQTKTQTENIPAYALYGNTDSNYNPWTPALGSYTLKATPYTSSGGTGTAGTALTIHFSVIKSSTPTISISAPVITSSGSASATQNSSFSYQITASNSPTSFGATGLPSGLTVNTSTGRISGTPTVRGSFNVTISAKNAGGTGTKTLTITIARARHR